LGKGAEEWGGSCLVGPVRLEGLVHGWAEHPVPAGGGGGGGRGGIGYVRRMAPTRAATPLPARMAEGSRACGNVIRAPERARAARWTREAPPAGAARSAPAVWEYLFIFGRQSAHCWGTCVAGLAVRVAALTAPPSAKQGQAKCPDTEHPKRCKTLWPCGAAGLGRHGRHGHALRQAGPSRGSAPALEAGVPDLGRHPGRLPAGAGPRAGRTELEVKGRWEGRGEEKARGGGEGGDRPFRWRARFVMGGGRRALIR
jgi:hypothetical protein